MSAVLDWLVAWLFRWLPRSVPTGLFAIGQPDPRSPVIATGDFSLTLARLRKALRGRDCWLLASLATFFAAGFDLAGIVSARHSDPERVLNRLRAPVSAEGPHARGGGGGRRSGMRGPRPHASSRDCFDASSRDCFDASSRDCFDASSRDCFGVRASSRTGR
jgi:hypothetical protein